MSEPLSREEKRRFLKALEEDEEFRYAVAGLIGISELLKRLDKLEANQEKLWMEVKSLREGQEKLWMEVKNLWLEVRGLRENQEKLWMEVKSLREEQEKLWLEVKSLREDQEKLWMEVKSLRENQEKLWVEVKSLRENQEEMLDDLRELRVSFERLTLSVEEEGRDVVRHRLKDELNVDIPIDRIWVDDREVNIYGASGDLCVIGEATVRLGVKLLDELEEKIAYIRGRRPDLLKPKLIKVVYADYAVPSALEKARDKGVWVVKWSGDLTPRIIHST